MTWWVSAVIAILGGGTVGGVVALATLPMQRRKLSAEGNLTEAQAAKVLSESSVALLKPAHEEIQHLRSELAEAREELAGTRREANRLHIEAQEARAETQELRNQVNQISKELTAAHGELERLRAAG